MVQIPKNDHQLVVMVKSSIPIALLVHTWRNLPSSLSWCWRAWFFAWLPSLNCALDLPKKTKKLKGIIYNTCRYIQNHNTMNPFIRMELTFKVFFKMKWKIAENCPLQMSFQLRCCDIPHKSMYLVHILMNEGVNDNSGRRRGVRCFSKIHYTPCSFPLCAFRPQQLSLVNDIICNWS